MTSPLDFFFKGNVAGCFEEASYPVKPGRYRFMACRSIGHYELCLALKMSPATCSFQDAGRVVEFRVTAILLGEVLVIDSITAGSTASS
jgi:hypothetical protein